MSRYEVSCHCGAVRAEVEGELDALETCNCSICVRTGYVHWTVEPERFRLLTPEANFTTYQFGTRTSKNHFCKTCGISPFRISRSEPDRIDVNVRCIPEIDLDSLSIGEFDGRNWEQTMANR